MDSDAVRAGLEDPQRIEAARRLLAEAPGEALDRLAALSARLLGAAHAQITLRTEEQVPVTPVAPRQPRADALCEQALAAARPLALAEVRDIEGIGSFLGVPIDVGGALVGVLCVYDAERFAWAEHDIDVLRELSGTVAAELERSALATELESSTVRLDLGFAAADIGSFDWDLVTNALHLDDRLTELFGYTRDTFVAHIDSFTTRVHPDDRPRVEAAISRAVSNCGEYEADYRVVHPGGAMRWVAARGRVLCDPEGRPVRMLGAAYDATEAQSAAERLGRVLETMSTAFLTIDRAWTFTYVNAAAERIFSRRRDELVGQRIWDIYPELVGTPTQRCYERALESHRPVSFEQHYPGLDTWFEVRATPTEDGLSVYFHDITDRVRAEREREEATGRLQILSEAGARLAGTLELSELLAILSDVVLNGFGEGVVFALREQIVAALEDREPIGADLGYRVAHVVGAEGVRGRSLPPDSFSAGVVLERRAEELVPGLGERPALAVPLVSRGRLQGAMLVLAPSAGAMDRRVLIELAARAGVALDNAVLFGAERRLALTLQRSLLPTELPRLPGIDLAARYVPGLGGREVGGDFYLVHRLEDGRLLLVIGDVMGHGTQAAARMGQLRAVLAAYAYDGDPPDRVLAHLSVRAPALLDVPMATVLAGIYDPAARVLTFALAGHLPPLLAPLDAPPAFIPAKPGPPLGAGVSDYARYTAPVPPGCTVVLYTDGLVEDRRRRIDVGLERLRQALIDIRLPPEAVCDHVLRELDRVEGAEDDVALLVMNHLPAPPDSSRP
jgi:PAS domain S-box-containing protein